MPYRKGQDCTLTIAGFLVIRASDVSFPKSSSEIDTTTRNSGVWEEHDVGHNRWEVAFTMKFFIGDSAVSTIYTAWAAQTQVTVARTGGVSTQGGSGYITRFDESEPIDDVVTIDIEIVGDGALA